MFSKWRANYMSGSSRTKHFDTSTKSSANSSNLSRVNNNSQFISAKSTNSVYKTSNPYTLVTPTWKMHFPSLLIGLVYNLNWSSHNSTKSPIKLLSIAISPTSLCIPKYLSESRIYLLWTIFVNSGLYIWANSSKVFFYLLFLVRGVITIRS